MPSGLLTIRGLAHSLPPMPRPATRNGRAEDRVFNAIIDAVLDHRLAPGTKLKERELSEIFGVSRGAVRAALTRLGHSLLVEQRPNRGAVIANPSLAETRDMFEARRVLEAAIVQRLAPSLTAKQIAELRKFVAEESRAYAKGDRKAGQRLSIRFHKVQCQHMIVISMLQQLLSRPMARDQSLASSVTALWFPSSKFTQTPPFVSRK